LGKGVVDIPVESAVYFHHGEEGRIIVLTGYSSRRGKSKILSYIKNPLSGYFSADMGSQKEEKR
jgi:hypothetical protein